MDEREPEARSGREFARVIAVASSWSFGYAAFYLLPKFLDEALDASAAEIGLTMGVFGLATVAVAPSTGSVVDRLPLRSVFLIGTLATAASSVGYLIIEDYGPLLLALRVVQAFAHALVFTAVSVAAIELAPIERLSRMLGLVGASMLVMNALAPAILEPVAASAGWRAVFLISAGTSVVSCMIAAGIRSAPKRRTQGTAAGFFATLSTPLGRDFAIVSATAGLAFGTVFAFEPALALGLGRERVGGFFVAFAAGAIGVRLGMGGLPDKVGRHAVAVAMLALYAASVLALSVAPASLFEVVGLTLGVSHGLFYPSLNGLVLAAVPPQVRGAIMAAFTAAFYFGFAGPSLLGFVAAAAGYRAVFALVGMTTAAGVVVLAASPALRRGALRAPAVSPTDPATLHSTQERGRV